jgi:SET domain-containing protein
MIHPHRDHLPARSGEENHHAATATHFGATLAGTRTGLFALQPVAACEGLIEYKGEVTSWRHAAARQRSDAGHTFVFGLSDGRGIDGNRGGNSARFLNHACEPNCEAIEMGGRVFIPRSLRSTLETSCSSHDHRRSLRTVRVPPRCRVMPSLHVGRDDSCLTLFSTNVRGRKLRQGGPLRLKQLRRRRASSRYSDRGFEMTEYGSISPYINSEYQSDHVKIVPIPFMSVMSGRLVQMTVCIRA